MILCLLLTNKQTNKLQILFQFCNFKLQFLYDSKLVSIPNYSFYFKLQFLFQITVFISNLQFQSQITVFISSYSFYFKLQFLFQIYSFNPKLQFLFQVTVSITNYSFYFKFTILFQIAMYIPLKKTNKGTSMRHCTFNNRTNFF